LFLHADGAFIVIEFEMAENVVFFENVSALEEVGVFEHVHGNRTQQLLHAIVIVLIHL
jgi:hypothetical protein